MDPDVSQKAVKLNQSVTHSLRCDMAFIEPMHRNKPNITYFLTHSLYIIIKANKNGPWANENETPPQGSTLSFLAGCPKSHFLGWYRNFLVYWYLKLDNQVVNSTCPKDKLGWIASKVSFHSFLPLGLWGRRGIVVACVCLSVCP